MKLFNVLSVLAGLLFSQLLTGQQVKEYYFSFPIQSREQISSITNLISIDDVRNDSVWAYANPEQFVKFAKEGFPITLLPHPGIAPDVVMSDAGYHAPMAVWNYYPTYTAYESLMTQFQTDHPSICQVTTFGTLPSGRKLMVAKISDNVATNETEPEFLYTSTMHGDETTGYILMMHLIDYLLSNYGTNPEVTDLVNNMEIFINPLTNPDGTYAGGNSTVSGATRGNANGIDLNRNYPDFQDGQHPDGYAWQPETIAFMDFAGQHDFVASANFHGGAEVVNYPFDTWATLSPDDNWWIYVSREYADTVHIHAVSGYMTYLNNGITNGYAWYEVNGGRQDYMGYYHHCRESTIEISDTKLLPASQLEAHWDYNWRSLILYMKQSRYGIHGQITDQSTGNPVVARVFVVGHDNYNTDVYSTSLGDYHRPIKAGTYTLEVSADCYQTQTIPNVVVTDKNTVTLNIQLLPGGNASVSTTPASSITMTTAVSGGNIACDAGSPITARGVCWSTTANPTIASSHTNDGTGTGVFTSNITGLSANTQYHVRAYATNANGTVYGEDLTFNTACGTITGFPWNEGFENGGSIPPCWTQEQVNSSGINWTFITGSGNGHPTSAHGGTYNATLKDNNAGDNKTRLISPPLNLSGLSGPSLSFWHTQAVWSGDQDQLAVYYKTSSGGTWTLLTTYTNSITTWTQETLSLPNASSDYYIAFEGNAKYGYGVCVDDVSVSGVSAPTLSVTPSNQNVTASAGTTSFTVTSNTNWTVTSNQTWCTVNPSGSGNGTITASYAANTGLDSRVANITVTVTGLAPVVVTVTQAGAGPTLSVTPANQPVSSSAGSTAFTVTSNSNWTVLSDQTWCTVTASGSGNGTITADYTQNLLTSQRIATITVTVSGLTPVTVTVTQAGAPVVDFHYTLENAVQTSDKTFEFDLLLVDLDPAQPFELGTVQAGVLISPSIYNGGTLTASIVPGTSTLNPSQQPASVTFAQAQNCLKLASKAPPGAGNGTILSTNPANPTRICRLKITNTVPFTGSSDPNLQFSFTTIPYPTRLSQYIAGINTPLTLNSSNCFVDISTPFLLNPPPAISVTPANHSVIAAAGSVNFTVNCNAAWVASSDQLWCTVSPAGSFGPATLTATYTENTTTSQRVANITFTVAGLSPQVVTVTQEGIVNKTLNLIVFLEGLYNGGGLMNPAMDENGYHWGPAIADIISIELHDASDYNSIVYIASNVSLATSGTASVTVPASFSGNYYLAVRHRNSIETVTAQPVSFAGATIAYSFDVPSKAFGSNMVQKTDGVWVVWGGDVNQDGLVDSSDMVAVDNDASNFVTGYLDTDLNGDGLIDSSDMVLLDNNASQFVARVIP